MDNLNQTLQKSAIKFDKLEPLFQSSDIEIYGFSVHRLHVVETWKQLRDIFNKTGCWPIVLGDKRDAENFLHIRLASNNQKTTDDIIKAASKLDINAWLKKRVEKYQIYQNPPRGIWSRKSDWDWRNDFGGYLNSAYQVDAEPPDESYIALIPVKESWHIPAVLKLIVWNNDRSYQEHEAKQEEEVHTAIFRKWEQEHGAEIMTIFGDFLEFGMARPPINIDAALNLAWEHFVYCADIIYEGAGTLDRLAESLMKGGRWVFWWD